MTSFGRGIGVALVVAAAACTARPLDPGTGGDTSTAPQHDAAPSVAGRDASTADPPRDAMDAIALRLCVHFAPSGFTMISR